MTCGLTETMQLRESHAVLSYVWAFGQIPVDSSPHTGHFVTTGHALTLTFKICEKEP